MARRVPLVLFASFVALGCGGGSSVGSGQGGHDASSDAPASQDAAQDGGTVDSTVTDSMTADSTPGDSSPADTSLPPEPDSSSVDSQGGDAEPTDSGEADGSETGPGDSAIGDSSAPEEGGPPADSGLADSGASLEAGDGAVKPGDASPDALVSYFVGGTLAGLAASESVVLQDNGGDNLTLMSDGSFTFPTRVMSGAAYAVTVLTQPSSPITQACTVSPGTATGTATMNVTSVAVQCATSSFKVGGTLSGLAAGASVTLQDNGGDTLDLTTDGSFSFPTPVASGMPYDVTILTPPAGQSCTVSAGSGTVGGGDVSGVVVNCSTTATFTVGGTLTGLAASDTLILDNGGPGNPIFLTSNGSFAFPTPVASGATYDVTVGGNPATPTPQTCTVTGGSGTVGAANVTTVSVQCVAETSCSAILAETPSTPNGTYTINPGNGDLTVYCDMTTAPGGWTVIFVPSSSTLSSETIGYTVNSPALMSAASQMLIAYRDGSMNVILDWASFGLTSNLRTQSPFEYAEIDEAVSVSISGASPVSTTLRYGYANWPNLCTDAWDAPTTAWGRICIENTTAPFYNGFAVGEGNYCPDSLQNYNQAGFPCSTSRQFTIAVR